MDFLSTTDCISSLSRSHLTYNNLTTLALMLLLMSWQDLSSHTWTKTYNLSGKRIFLNYLFYLKFWENEYFSENSFYREWIFFQRIIDDKLCCAGCIRETTQEIRFQTGSVSLTEAFNYLKANGLRWIWTEFPPAVKDFLYCTGSCWLHLSSWS